jgi:5-methylcytosine-specific restriction endonuclease McrA
MKKKQLIRLKFSEAVFGRDGHKCVFCNATEDLDAHHITDRNEMPNGGYVKENGITLCPIHHLVAENYHSSGKTEWTEGFHPDELYKMIDSSYRKAYRKSEEL